MNWVRIILRLAIALVVCWGVGAAAVVATIGIHRVADLRLSVYETSDHYYSRWVFVGGSTESVMPDLNGMPSASASVKRALDMSELNQLPASFRRVYEASASTRASGTWFRGFHALTRSGLPLPCWIAQDYD